MPEAVGSSSTALGACRHVTSQAGSPRTGSPLFCPARAMVCLLFIGLAALPLCPDTARAGKAKSETVATPESAPAANFGVLEAAQVADPAQRQELTQISQEFAATVTAKTLARLGPKAGQRHLGLLALHGKDYRDTVRADALAKLQAAGADLTTSQYFVYADRNPGAQLLILAFYDASGPRVVLLGADLISSGKLRPGEDSFITPLGVFENLPENWGYRAQGSKNSKGWRGLGARGSRVWDFGYQQAPRQFRQGVYDSQMRLLMHATDPDQGEPRLGGPDSKGCVRVSAAANAFLDRRSILDRHYEQIAGNDKTRDLWLLRPDRAPVSHPGSYLVVGDSAQGNAAR
ncbi:hypothetical protein GTA51_02015 [Desulfovibrio aerotolerans]|uniref:L,D-transpeptidase family protein n=1 Tax=Solidesulfovibrio aerotolerans TaxID=295255 RepID=A0A7C9MMM3_9BACT|nr:L,D-transpeptidase [Solidesulfovibrio aerotolerans]MYL81912.1 hypothetical protein [Solidesulfovibrio aerotolerans]